MTRRAGALLAIAVGAAFVPTSSPADAAPIAVTTGWWSTSPAITFTDVPDGGLVAQGGPSTPTAYSAVAFRLDAADDADGLRLVVAPGSLSVPTSPLAVCPLVEELVPVEGGRIADAPAYDCAAGVPGTATADGTAFDFDLAALPSPGTAEVVALAIVPLGPTARVVFQPPGLDALSLAETRSPSPAGGTTDGPTSAPPATQPSASASSTGAAASGPGRVGSSRSGATPATTAAPAPLATAGASPPTSSPAVAAPITPTASVTSGADGSPLLLVVFIGLVALIVLLWTATGRRSTVARPQPVG